MKKTIGNPVAGAGADGLCAALAVVVLLLPGALRAGEAAADKEFKGQAGCAACVFAKETKADKCAAAMKVGDTVYLLKACDKADEAAKDALKKVAAGKQGEAYAVRGVEKTEDGKKVIVVSSAKAEDKKAAGVAPSEAQFTGKWTCSNRNWETGRLDGGFKKKAENEWDGELTATNAKGEKSKYVGTLTGDLRSGEVKGVFHLGKVGGRKFLIVVNSDGRNLTGKWLEVKPKDEPTDAVWGKAKKGGAQNDVQLTFKDR